MTHPGSIALTIAGSDSGGGAGIQADLKAFSARGAYGASVITAITAQNTRAVTAVHPVPVDIVGAQIDAVFDDLDVRAIKVGMLFSPELTEVVAKRLDGHGAPVVLDPVMVAKSGDTLLQDAAIEALRTRALPLATLLTPNLPEAARLLDQPAAEDVVTMERQGRALCDLGAGAVLMKGGHGSGETCIDLLVRPDSPAMRLTAPRQHTRNTHGTGCTLSSAIAAELALGHALDDAVAVAHGYLQGAIRAADRLSVGSGHGPVHHFHALWSTP
ncbi:MAG: bifunctional hydroxymethylpyrimidine kinase/phosphomethylpyrimidine kinase [Pseudomonadota bacterium]